MMAYLLDSNILLRVARPADTDHLLVRIALQRLREQGEPRYYVPQNLMEFWTVCTRPTSARGGFGFTPAQTEHAARLVERLFTLLPDSPAVHPEWRRLVAFHNIQGVQVYDARLVAVMYVHGLTHILTLNPTDFARYPGIIAVHPGSI